MPKQDSLTSPVIVSFSHQERKQRPVLTGLLDYFPDACMEVANCSFICNEQHNPGQPMYWAKGKSIGEGNEIVRHLMDRRTARYDTDKIRHLAKAAWRALELLQRDIEAERAENQRQHEARGIAEFGPTLQTPGAHISSTPEAPSSAGPAQPSQQEVTELARRYLSGPELLKLYQDKMAPVRR